jgi:hypothetical protein
VVADEMVLQKAEWVDIDLAAGRSRDKIRSAG